MIFRSETAIRSNKKLRTDKLSRCAPSLPVSLALESK